jgi:ubiquinone/menaquinone biosynthesis C-methylase UbiE
MPCMFLIEFSYITLTMSYVLPVGADDDKRLAIQSETLHGVTWTHLDRAGLKNNYVVADIGCGNGDITCYLLTKASIIYAIDMYDEQLEITKKNVEKYINDNKIKDCATVHYIKADITNLSESPLCINMAHKMDLVFMRFVLSHIKPDNYHKVFANIIFILKNKGVVAIEDVVWDRIYCSVNTSDIDQYKKYMLEKTAGNFNLNIGRTFGDIIPTKLFEIVENEIIDRPITVHQFKNMYYALVDSLNKKSPDEWLNNFCCVIDSIDENDPNIIVRTSGTALLTLLIEL